MDASGPWAAELPWTFDLPVVRTLGPVILCLV
jgi:hypothetical protein